MSFFLEVKEQDQGTQEALDEELQTWPWYWYLTQPQTSFMNSSLFLFFVKWGAIFFRCTLQMLVNHCGGLYMIKAFYFIMKERFVYPKILSLPQIIISSKVTVSPLNPSPTYPSPTKLATSPRNSGTLQNWRGKDHRKCTDCPNLLVDVLY